jgi:hypothetical protein
VSVLSEPSSLPSSAATKGTALTTNSAIMSIAAHLVAFMVLASICLFACVAAHAIKGYYGCLSYKDTFLAAKIKVYTRR